MGLGNVRIYSFMPHLDGTVHSNTVICLDIAILKSFFFNGSQDYVVFLRLQRTKMFLTTKYVGRQPRRDMSRLPT